MDNRHTVGLVKKDNSSRRDAECQTISIQWLKQEPFDPDFDGKRHNEINTSTTFETSSIKKKNADYIKNKQIRMEFRYADDVDTFGTEFHYKAIKRHIRLVPIKFKPVETENEIEESINTCVIETMRLKEESNNGSGDCADGGGKDSFCIKNEAICDDDADDETGDDTDGYACVSDDNDDANYPFKVEERCASDINGGNVDDLDVDSCIKYETICADVDDDADDDDTGDDTEGYACVSDDDDDDEGNYSIKVEEMCADDVDGGNVDGRDVDFCIKYEKICADADDDETGDDTDGYACVTDDDDGSNYVSVENKCADPVDVGNDDDDCDGEYSIMDEENCADNINVNGDETEGYVCDPGDDDDSDYRGGDNTDSLDGNDSGSDKEKSSVCEEQIGKKGFLKQMNYGKETSCEEISKLVFHNISQREMYRCIVCEKAYKCKSSFNVHIRSHTGERPFACQGCDKRFIRIYPRDVKQNSLNAYYKCRTCAATFRMECALQRHSQIHRPDYGRFYPCRLCKKSFSLHDALSKHMSSAHKERVFRCKLCTKFFTKNYLKTHMLIHAGVRAFQCTQCEKSYTKKDYLMKHMVTHDKTVAHKCPFCEKKLPNAFFLTVHVRSHTGEKPYKCSSCDMSFIRKTSLTKHIRTHTGEKPFKCSECPKRFARRDVLSYHARTHTGDNPVCSVCNRSFLYPQNFKEHMRTHTGEKPHQCEICGKGFGYYASFQYHMIHVHGKTERL